MGSPLLEERRLSRRAQAILTRVQMHGEGPTIELAFGQPQNAWGEYVFLRSFHFGQK